MAASQFFLVSLTPIWFIEKAGRRNCMICGGKLSTVLPGDQVLTLGFTAAAQAVIMALLCVGLALKTKPALAMMVAMYYLFDDAFAVRFVPWKRPRKLQRAY